MKKRIVTIMLALSITSLLLSSCNLINKKDDNDQPLKQTSQSQQSSTPQSSSELIDDNWLESIIGDDIPTGAIAVLINNPTEEQLDKLAPAQTVVLSQTDEVVVLIPTEKAKSINISKLKMGEKGLEVGESVIDIEDVHPKNSIILKVNYAEGIPQHRVILEGEDCMVAYDFIYNGKDGTSEYEFILNS